MEEENSCFVDEQLNAYPDQWTFLSSIQKVSTSHLDAIFNTLQPDKVSVSPNINSERLHIQLNSVVRLNRSGMTPELINFLKEELNFANSEYFIKKKSGRNTWGTERYFRFIEETEHEVIIPRGFIGRLIRYCKQQDIDFEFQDERKKHTLREAYTLTQAWRQRVSAQP
ncbi:MAG: hypothetical protein WD048_01675 [Chitinophagales bacterium]